MPIKHNHNGGEPQAGTLYKNSTAINVSKPGRIVSAVAGLILLYKGTGKFSPRNLVNSTAGTYLLYRGISGNCPVKAALENAVSQKHIRAVNIRTSFIVKKPRELVYNSWRQLNNLPLFMQHLKTVKIKDDIHSQWKIQLIGGVSVDWEAEILKEVPGTELSWRSLPGSMIETAGKIVFHDTAEGNTRLDIMVSYRPPAGFIGANVADMLNPAFADMVSEDIYAFRQFIEKENVPVTNNPDQADHFIINT